MKWESLHNKLINSKYHYFHTDNGVLLCGDCLEVMKELSEGSIDAIITDPPYGINKKKIQNDETLYVYFNIIPISFYLLKDNTFLVLFSSIEKIGEVIKFCENSDFKYRWQTIFYIKNGMVRGSLGFSVYYPTLFFMKGYAKIKQQLRDVIEGIYSPKIIRYHPYQKDLKYVEKIVETISNSSNLILDPFLGSGTTAVACENLNRRWIGIEIEEKYCEITKKRIQGIQ